MNAQLTINGQTISIRLTQEQVEQLTKKKSVKKWEDLEKIEGWYISGDAVSAHTGDTYRGNKNVYATENQARSALAMAQLSQLMKDVNGDWKPDWGDSNNSLIYTIHCSNRFAYNTSTLGSADFLAFPTKEIRNKFLEDHRELIEEYFLMYK